MKVSMDRVAASTGIGFAVFFVVSGFLPGAPKKWNASALDIQGYLEGKNSQILAAMIVSGLALILFLWFLASFAGMFRDAGQGRLATVMYGAGVATVAIAAIGDGIQLALAKVTYTADLNTVAAMYGVGTWLYTRIFWTMAALAFAAWIATNRSKAMPSWYGLLSLVVGCISIIGGLSLKDSGFFSITGGMGLVGFLSIAVWVGLSSVLLIQRVGAETPSAAPAMG